MSPSFDLERNKKSKIGPKFGLGCDYWIMCSLKGNKKRYFDWIIKYVLVAWEDDVLIQNVGELDDRFFWQWFKGKSKNCQKSHHSTCQLLNFLVIFSNNCHQIDFSIRTEVSWTLMIRFAILINCRFRSSWNNTFNIMPRTYILNTLLPWCLNEYLNVRI